MLADVNTTDIASAIRLGCRTMCSVFNDDDNDVPFFGSQVWPDAFLSFSTSASEAHVPGRHLNALLNAEDVLGLTLEEGCIDRHARAAFLSYSGELPLPLNRNRIGGPLQNFYPHNVREGFHALYALARFRSSAPAGELAERSIRAIQELWHSRKGWDRDRIESKFQLHSTTFIIGLARAIGPLVKLHRHTVCAGALELALELADKATSEFFLPSGAYDRETFGAHTHSTTCVMSSLAQLADLTRDANLMERVRAFYDNGLNDIRDQLGWVIESSDEGRDPDRGEVNNTGDIVETSLLLGQWGYPQYYEDAERILRCHLLPSQLRDVSFIRDPDNPHNEDGKCDVANRHLGGFGFPAPYGHKTIDAERISFNMDIVGGAVASLCEVYRQAVATTSAGHYVHLHFDHETEAVDVESPYTHRHMRVRAKRPGPLFVRLPSWVESNSVSVDGLDIPPCLHNGYLVLSQPPVNRWITIQFDLAERDIVLSHRTRDIKVRLRGDSVAAMSNFGAEHTFFPALEE
ncbi:MAG: hypothetical protein F4047_08765 [Caldilineaceae bacterium SB0670_bin_27]|uniref:Uncharacterized protein n=1 Tax=Caldilineaceae bacterium SB0664_bin_27 TaxID=2605260 RepID=A0A6B0YRD6_9CHLR|nr:hypothetical protein [Caldilineaceae bacterium SB0664_bin_27]MYJ78222.1 hypothetical protein [Caldilineaceae bacterium SB0670_bin_27]